MFYTSMINQQMDIYKYVQSHVILQQRVSVTPVTIIRASYNNNTTDIQIIVQISMIKAPEFLQCSLWSQNLKYIIVKIQ